MLNFADIQPADKAEQVRAWSIEKAIDRLAGTAVRLGDLTNKADEIEQYILNGKQGGQDGSEQPESDRPS